MKKPIWMLKDRIGNQIWSSYERDYLHVIDEVLRHLGYELVRLDLEVCEECGQCNGACICQID